MVALEPSVSQAQSKSDSLSVLLFVSGGDGRHPPLAESRALAFWVFEMTRGRGFAPNVRAANEWMRGTLTEGWVSGVPAGFQ
jgi:hypothetical protein